MGQCICRGTRDQTIIDDESIHSNHSDEIPNHGTDHELKMDMHNINAYDCDPDVPMNPDCSPRCYKSILFPGRSYDNQDVKERSLAVATYVCALNFEKDLSYDVVYLGLRYARQNVNELRNSNKKDVFLYCLQR
eukprot:705887_1